MDAQAFKDTITWIESVTEDGDVGYRPATAGSWRPSRRAKRFPADQTRALDAAVLLTRLLLGASPREECIQTKAGYLLWRTPEWNLKRGRVDMYYWLYGTMALHHVGGKPWKTWRKALLEAVLPHQEENGSWPPVGVWGADGGRVYSTAMMVLALETGYRHARAKQ